MLNLWTLINENQLYNNSIINELDGISSIKNRLKFAKEKLKLIGSGSARIVFALERDKVLKIAKDERGIEQNKVEINISKEKNKLFTGIFDYADDLSWIVAEYALPCKASDFKKIYGITHEDLYAFLYCLEFNIKPGTSARRVNDNALYSKYKVPMIDVFAAWHRYRQTGNANENKFGISNKCGNFLTRWYQYITTHPEFVIEEMIVLENLGVVERQGKKAIVIVDPGMNGDIFDNMY